MKNSKALFQDLVEQITLNEDHDEVQSMVYQLMENVLGLNRADILSGKPISIVNSTERLSEIIRRINQSEPLQYILGEAHFFGRKFKVNSSVLIPRPETEELVSLIVSHVKNRSNQSNEKIRMLDIGTGSGCIPISLSLEIPNSEIFALDISEEALSVARQNMQLLQATVEFFTLDILQDDILLNHLDIVVSNPPYIALSEMKTMSKNVKDYEPHLALFVEEDDPLIFYKAIATKARNTLRSGGLIAVEINERFGKEVAHLFELNNFRAIEIIKDLSGKERIVKGIYL